MSTPVPVNYTWSGGLCNSDEDCYPKIKERVPTLSEIIGVNTCECYANSNNNPLDECQGESDMTCPIAGCMENLCQDARAYCSADSGVCALDTSGSTTPANIIAGDGTALDMQIPCSTDDECFIVQRFQAPDRGPTGVSVCGCYSNSVTFPFDECEGTDMGCMMATCMTGGCDGLQAYCMLDEDANGFCNILATSEPSVTTATGTGSTEYSWSGGICTTDDDCFASNRQRSPSLTEIIGVGTCECYGNSYFDPLDECQGESDATCSIARCVENPCDGVRAYCSVEEMICLLDAAATETVVEPSATATTLPSANGTEQGTTISSTTSTFSWSGGICSTDDDCFPKIRERVPASDTMGVDTCECYAASYQDPLDECQGESDMTCPIADCMGSSCGDSTANCDQDTGTCMLSTSAGFGQNNSTNGTLPVTAAADANATSNATVESLDNSTAPQTATNTSSASATAANAAFKNETVDDNFTDASSNVTAETTANETNSTDSTTVETASNDITFTDAQGEASSSIIDKVYEDLKSRAATKKIMPFLMAGLAVANWMIL